MARPLENPVVDPTYLEFFGLTQPPFARIADPSHFFPNEQYTLLTEKLSSAAANADSLVVICGADGSGKTTLVNRFIASIGDSVSCVIIDEACQGEEQFYGTFLSQIGFEEITGTAKELQNITKEFLVCRGIAGDHVLIIIDDAHLTDPIVLEQLRLLCEIKIKDRRVLSVVLAGNADIVRVVDAPAMRETKFYSHVVFSIRNFSEEDTTDYVWHRLRLAGGVDGVKLADGAIPLIHRYSGGTPRLINRLCDDMLAEACSLDSHVITEKIVRTAADKQQLLPHVIPLHGKGRRKSDPDVNRAQAMPETASDNPEELLQQIAQYSKQIEDLRADRTKALQDIEARNNDIIVLRDELDSQTSEVKKLTSSLADDANVITQQTLAISNSAMALQDSENKSKKLADDLENETRAREAAEKELADATANVENLSQLKTELQATVEGLRADLEAGLEASDERAAEIEAIEKNSSDLKGEIEGKAGELDSLRDELDGRNASLAELERRLEESQSEYESAQQHILALKNPEELEEIEKASDKRFEKEARAREAAEDELAKATATVEELSQQKTELQATVDEVQADLEAGLKLADERAAAIEALEKNTVDLKGEVEGKTSELDSIRDELNTRNEALADLEIQLEESQAKYESAQQHISALKNPEELEEIQKVSEQRAADLRNETRARKTAEENLTKATATVEDLSQLKTELQATVEEVRADLENGLKVADERAAEIEALEKSTADLKAEVESTTGDLDSVRDDLASRNEILADLEKRFERSQSACELAQQRIVDLKSPKELEDIEKASNALATDLEEQNRAREAAEEELAKATATVEELDQLKSELQSTVEEVQADLEARIKVADERAEAIEALEKNITDLKGEIEGKTGELDSLRDELNTRNEVLADLEIQLEESKAKYDSAQQHISALKNPEELKEIEKVSEKRAADLRSETRARKAVEDELAKSTDTVENLSQQKTDLQSTVEGIQADLEARIKVADERAEAIEALEKNTVDLEGKIEGKTGELDSLRDELNSRVEALADLEIQLEELQAKYDSAQQHISVLKNPEELEEIEKVSEKRAADLRSETRARKAAEDELAKATATVEELDQQKTELQATVEGVQADLEAGLKLADERAAAIEALEKNTADLNGEIEGKTGELDSLRDELNSRIEALADLGIQLEESQAKYDSAQQHISALKNPEELEEIEKVSEKRAADLRSETRARKTAEDELAKASAAVEDLGQQKTELQATVEEVQADLEAGLKLADERAAEIEALEKNTADLKDEVESKTGDLESVRDDLALRNEILADLEIRFERSQSACELAQQRIVALKSPSELEEIEEASNKLTTDLEEQTRRREAAEDELAKATATVEELDQQKTELQATVEEVQADLEAGLKLADERAAAIEALEKNAVDLEGEVEGKTGEITSLRDEQALRIESLADLEIQLEESQAKYESAQQRISALKHPEELEKIQKVSEERAADLRSETRARKAAEDELAKSAAAVEDLSQQKAELQATVEGVQADLDAGHKLADERAAEIEALEKNTADLKGEVKSKTGELDSLRDELNVRNEALADLESQLEESQSECESAQLRIAALKNPEELEEVEKVSDERAADLRKETRAREAAEDELAKATAAVEDLSQQKTELQATVSDLRADLKKADERAVDFDELERNAVELKDEIEGQTGELDSLRAELASRNEALADLEIGLEESHQELASAERRISSLAGPKELEEIQKASDKLATDLEGQILAREITESELAEAAATVEKLSKQRTELNATIRDLNADLILAGERAVDVYVLKRDVTDLKEEVEKRTSELDSRNQAFADLEKQLEASQQECELLRRRGPTSTIDEYTAPEETVAESDPDVPVNSSHAVEKFASSIRSVPAYQALRKYDPAFYVSLITTYKKLVAQNFTEKQINDALRAEQAELMDRLLSKASDEAIITYARLIVDQLDELELDGIEPCLRLLIPESNPDINETPVYSEATKERELDALELTLKSYDADRPLPAESDVWPDLEPIFDGLFTAFGAENVAALENSYDQNVDRGLVCGVSRSLYSGILDLPKHKAADALRWLCST